MTFNRKTRSVHIAPRGAKSVDAAYSYSFVEEQAASGQANVRRGRLHIKRANGLEADLPILLSKDDRILTLLFNGGAEAQRYVRTALPRSGNEAKNNDPEPIDASAAAELQGNRAAQK